MSDAPSTLIVACGALARELMQLIRANGWRHMAVTCLPAHLHNTPALIPEALRAKIRANRDDYERILVLYGDCGTAGAIDAVLDAEGAERIGGAHCYEFYAGSTDFERLAEAAPGSFFLTDYLVRHFDRLIIRGLGLDRYPHLLPEYFGNYDRLVYLAQVPDETLKREAEAAAQRLGLEFHYHFTGFGGIGEFLSGATDRGAQDGKADHRLLA